MGSLQGSGTSTYSPRASLNCSVLHYAPRKIFLRKDSTAQKEEKLDTY